jgi:hypothetical protein
MDYKKLINNNPGTLVEKLIAGIKEQKAVDVRYEFDRKDQWAVVNVYLDQQDDELALRLYSAGNYELYVGYYDEEDELQELSKTLTDDEKNMIPVVVADEDGIRVPGNLLSS